MEELLNPGEEKLKFYYNKKDGEIYVELRHVNGGLENDKDYVPCDGLKHAKRMRICHMTHGNFMFTEYAT